MILQNEQTSTYQLYLIFFSTGFGGCFDDTDSQEAALRQSACVAAAKSQRRGMDGGKEEEASLFLDYKVSAPPVKTAVAANCRYCGLLQ